MTSGARVQAAIELLDQIIDAAQSGGAAADTLITRYFSTRRYAGSKDRRAVRELVYDAIRRAGEVPVNGRAAMVGLAQDRPDLGQMFTGEGHAPAPIDHDEPIAPAGIAPEWVLEQLSASGVGTAQWASMLERAPLDIRVNSLKADPALVQAMLDGAEVLPRAPNGLRLPVATNVDQTELYRDGQIEVQDAGSQIVSALAGAEPGMTVIDLCAGGGGKTLALAADMKNTGHLIASDTDRARLSRLAPRAERAGVSIVETRLLNPGKEAEMLSDLDAQADLVVIDAPCSGSGTWRRNPELRWRLSPARIMRYADMQARLLTIGAALVKPGGRLVFITCSLFDAEGKDQIDGFLSTYEGWHVNLPSTPPGAHHGAGLRLTPFQDSTDGFFIATMTRPC